MVEKPNTQETDQGWIDDINRHIQALLATPELHGREVEARSRPDLSLEIVVDGEVFSDVESIADGAVRDLVKAAIERWQNETATTLAFATLPLRRPLPFTTSRSMPRGSARWTTTPMKDLLSPARRPISRRSLVRAGSSATGSKVSGHSLKIRWPLI